ncbi:hemerythrin [Geotalea uraniireducens]|uniref:Hemerythrin n=1 Tax=Geotalea uraniireducens TaxID=351604 RepID=A0ABM8EP34_9BACT|nr:bacteriohemerythrin [Geotalea uraniireducens]BDV44349.1 hemerythrin [Geotalea uraniireducens]
MAIGWRDDLLTGITEIDNQHKELFRRFGDLLTACNEGRGAAEVSRLYSFLDDYVIDHFKAEERLMREKGYPDYAQHKEQHDFFRRKLTELKKQVRDEGAGVAVVISTNQMMIDWLTRHIEIKDKEYVPFLQA